MKTPSFHHRASTRRGVNILGILVLIGLTAILIWLFLNARTPGLVRQKRAKAMNMCEQFQTSALSYYTEYSVYPTPSGVTTDYVLTDADNDNAIHAKPGSWGPADRMPQRHDAAHRWNKIHRNALRKYTLN